MNTRRCMKIVRTAKRTHILVTKHYKNVFSPHGGRKDALGRTNTSDLIQTPYHVENQPRNAFNSVPLTSRTILEVV